ncbi:MAG: 23S rRNA (uracil-5-)-methyltransferase RumA [Candidatus Amoebophilus sp. 36-38]|nr:MAG: 23S rRNA (uracil-5-)-methyltransferase RumA [Candidatus Amoebophilus sp. 36-38]
MAHKYKQQLIKNVVIGDLAEGNRCVARVDNQVIFVEQAAPGDVMDIQITKKKRGYAEAIPVELHTPGPNRVEPFCIHFGICGGCQWQHIAYEAQLVAKEQLVRDKLTRLGRIVTPPVAKILAAEPTVYYRNKLEYTFSNKRWLSEEEIQSNQPLNRDALGFHKPGYFDKVVDITHCHLQAEPSNVIRLAIARFVRERGFSFYDFKNHQGLLRNLIIRTTLTGEVMVLVQFGQANEADITATMEFIQSQFPTLTSLQYVINTKFNETFYDLPVACYAGKPFITEIIDGLQWRIGPKSFFQTNSTQAKVLYKTVEALANLQGHELVYDLYTGVGTIAHFLARKARHVVGIEMIEGAIEDAKINAALNHLTNVSFWLGDMKDVFNEDLLAACGKPDLIVVDPPRAGMHPAVIQQLLAVAPEKIIYVSCNPATQARDLYELQEKYELTHAQPIDMFPHTSHVENVALLVRKA